MMLWEILLWATTTLAGCTGAIYLGYYLYIMRASKEGQKEQTNPDFRPRITVIVPTYNGGRLERS